LEKEQSFEKLCDWLEVNDFELLTLQDIVKKADDLACGSNVYTDQYLKQKLLQRYGDHIQFCEVRGRQNVVCWKEMAAYIVSEKWYEDQKHDKMENIVITAAKLLKAAIREANYKKDVYPTCNDVSDTQRAREWLPNLLRTFLDTLICPEGKKIALGHNIVQAVRPRSVIAPIPFAVGVTVDHLSA